MLTDINWVVEDCSRNSGQTFLDALHNNFLEHFVKYFTRYRVGNTPSLLDLIIVFDINIIQKLALSAPLGKGDHLVLTFEGKSSHAVRKTNSSKPT